MITKGRLDLHFTTEEVTTRMNNPANHLMTAAGPDLPPERGMSNAHRLQDAYFHIQEIPVFSPER